MGIAVESARGRGLLLFALGAALVGASFFAGRWARRTLVAASLPQATTTAVAVSPSGPSSVASPSPTPATVPAVAPSPADQLAGFFAEPVAHRRKLSLWETLRTADETGVRALLADTNRRPASARRDEALALIYRRWGELNPAAALATTSTLFGPAISKAESAIVRGWGTVAPRAALDWCLALNSPAAAFEQSAQLTELRASLEETRRFPEVAPRLAALSADEQARYSPSAFASAFTSAWVDDDVGAAVAWLGTLPAGPMKRVVVGAAIRQVAHDAPDLALDLAQSINDRAERAAAFSSLFSAWGKQDANTARAVVDRQLTGLDHDAAQAALVPQLVRASPREAVDRLAAIADESIRNQTVNRLRFDLQNTQQPELAVEVIQRWFAAEKRDDAIAAVFNQWRKRDAAAADRFLQTSPRFTPEQRAKLAAKPTPPS